jgi:hypothetical protein
MKTKFIHCFVRLSKMFVTNTDNWELTKRTTHNISNRKEELSLLIESNKEKFLLVVDADVGDVRQNAPDPFPPVFFFDFVEPIIP